jgi:hypothetical protein
MFPHSANFHDLKGLECCFIALNSSGTKMFLFQIVNPNASVAAACVGHTLKRGKVERRGLRFN